VRTRPEFLTNVLIAEAILAGLLLLAFTIFARPTTTDREIKSRGKPVQGTAVAKRVNIPPRDSGQGYVLPYRYNVNGKAYAGKAEVTLERFYTTPADAPVTVWYLPERPEVSTLSGAIEHGDPSRDIRYVLVGIAGVMGLVTLTFRAFERRQRQILRNWAAIPVAVRDVQNVSVGDYRRYEVVLADDAAGEWNITTSDPSLSTVGVETILLQNPEQRGEIRLVSGLPFVELVPADRAP
jgi:hypothetical protein